LWKAVAVGGADTVTVTGLPTGGEMVLNIAEVAGADASCTIDQTASNDAGSGTQSSGNMTPTTNGQFVWGFTICSGSCGTADLTQLDFSAGATFDFRSEYQIQTTATTVAVSFTGGSGQWGAIGATLKAASAASSFVVPLTVVSP